MTHPDSKRLRWLLVAALATTTVITASSASAQRDPLQGAAAGRGTETATPAIRNTLESCMAFWDARTHMSKSEWRAACRRTLNGTDMDVGGLDLLASDHPAAAQGSATQGKKYRGRTGGSRR